MSSTTTTTAIWIVPLSVQSRVCAYLSLSLGSLSFSLSLSLSLVVKESKSLSLSLSEAREWVSEWPWCGRRRRGQEDREMRTSIGQLNKKEPLLLVSLARSFTSLRMEAARGCWLVVSVASSRNTTAAAAATDLHLYPVDGERNGLEEQPSDGRLEDRQLQQQPPGWTRRRGRSGKKLLLLLGSSLSFSLSVSFFAVPTSQVENDVNAQSAFSHTYLDCVPWPRCCML